MENFDWTTFQKKIAIKASLEELYDAWTITEKIESWFLSNAVFYTEEQQAISTSATIKKGYTYEWSWFLFDIIEKGTIIDANGVDNIQFTFAGNCLVDVTLTKQGEYVLVTLIQKNIPTDNASKRGIRLGCESGWSFFLLNLKSVYEGGLDLRNKDVSLKGMLNN